MSGDAAWRNVSKHIHLVVVLKAISQGEKPGVMESGSSSPQTKAGDGSWGNGALAGPATGPRSTARPWVKSASQSNRVGFATKSSQPNVRTEVLAEGGRIGPQCPARHFARDFREVARGSSARDPVRSPS